jgi:hypothetical protein
MTISSGGGSATNSGIDYQQRVASLFLAHLLLDIDVSYILEIHDSAKIAEVSFETASCIDDIEIKLIDGIRVLIQAKRKISFSSSKNSQFCSAIEQFVNEYALNTDTKNFYILATSNQTSSKITYELRKILESIRINDSGFINNPLNKSEQRTFTDYLSITRNCFRKSLKRNVTDEEIYKFSKRVKVLVLDVEQSMGLEKAILTLLADRTQVNPNLIWAALISNSIYFSSKRLSINKEGLLSKFGNYLSKDTETENNKSNKEELIKWEIKLIDKVASAREILLIESFVEQADYLMVELIRFNKDCSRRFTFKKNHCLLPNGSSWTVIYRCSTYAGMERILEEKQDHFLKDKKIIVIPANLNKGEDVENSLCSTIHSELCDTLLSKNKEPLSCLHCGKSISGVASVAVEIDEIDVESILGSVHLSCLQPVDRVIGIIDSQFSKDYRCLKKFDFQLWAKQLWRGQYRFASFRDTSIVQQNIPRIVWQSDYTYNSTYSFCVKINLENGTARYISQRGKLDRMNLVEAEKTASDFNNSFEASKDTDPFCYTSKTYTYGSYSQLLRIKGSDERCIKCVSAEVAKYNRVLEKTYNQCDNFYAPVFIILDEITELPLQIQKRVAMMTDPLDFENYIENWKNAGINIVNYEIKIIESDWEFDMFVASVFQSKTGLVVDPIIDKNQDFIKAIFIEDGNRLLKRAGNIEL